MEGIISSLIAGGLALVGVIISNASANKKIEQQLVTAQAVTDTKIDNLTAEVKAHNEYFGKIPVIENDIERIKTDIEELKKEVHGK